MWKEEAELFYLEVSGGNKAVARPNFHAAQYAVESFCALPGQNARAYFQAPVTGLVDAGDRSAGGLGALAAAQRRASPAAMNRRIEASLADESNAIRGRVHAVVRLRRLGKING